MLPDPPTPTQGWAQHRKNRAIVLDVENSPGVAACGLGAHSGVCCSKSGSTGGSQLWESQEVQFPSCQRTSCGSNIGQEVSKVGRVGRETELRAIQRSIRRGKLPSLLAGPWTRAPRLVHALTCQGQGWMMEEKCLLTDLVPPPLSRITVSKNSQPVTYLCIYHF